MRGKFRLEEGWSTFGLLVAMLTTVSFALAAAEWTDGLDSISLVGMLAVTTGLALAKSRFNAWGTTPFVAGYGVFFIGWLNGRRLEDFPTWQERIASLAHRVWVFLETAFGGGTSRDRLMFVIFVMAVTWIMGIAAAWSVFRRGRVWPAVIPAGVVLFVNVYYYQGPNNLQVYLVLYLLLLLLLVARMHLHGREVEWRASRVVFSPELRFDVLRASLLAAILALSLAWAAPSAAASPDVSRVWGRMTRPWNEVREGWNRLFSSLKSYGYVASDYFGDTLVLSGPRAASNRPIMDVAALPLPAGRYYWRARVFDTYEDGRWQSGDHEQVAVTPDDEFLKFSPYQGRRQVILTFTSFMPAVSVLYVAAQPEWVDRPVYYELSFTQSGMADITVVRSRRMLTRGESYSELASIASVDADNLRQAGEDYPLWVRARYLQVPDETTGRTRELARTIMADQLTPYDKAVAVTAWLRENITYNDQRLAAPPGVEPVDHLLFEDRQGYCNYYASAMILMLRSQGIPARMAVGFAQGEYLAEQGGYRVRERDAHAWPEVFFPGFGWVEFEPTVSQEPLLRPQPAQTPEQAGEDPDTQAGNDVDRTRDDLLPPEDLEGAASGSAPTRIAGVRWQTLALLIGAGIAALAGLVAAWWILEYSGMGVSLRGVVLGALAQALSRAGLALPMGLAGYAGRQATGLSPPVIAYGRLMRALRWLGVRLPVSRTPYERVEAFYATLPDGREPAQAIAGEYVQEVYANRPGNDATARAAWSALRLGVWLEVLKRRLS